ncbi:MAG: hypothetical protein ACM30E_04915 [Nitrososphaerales archaeon]
MKQHDAESWRKAVGAQQSLVEKYAGDPAVTLIDLGYPPQDCEHGDRVVIRIHLTEERSRACSDGRATFEREVDGIPVCVVRRK